jgi:predicted bacteriocin transport accessory protein
MKKIFVLLIILVSAFMITGCGGPKTYDEISYDEYKNKLSNGDEFILFIGAETCSACSAYKIGLNKVIEKYKIDVKYLDIDELSDTELSKLKSKFYFSGTPTTVFIKDGKEDEDKDRIVGNVKYSKIVETMKKNGYIKE